MTDPANTKRETLKSHFKNNSTPTEDHFAELIDNTLIKDDDNLYVDTTQAKLGIGVSDPSATLEINSPEDNATFIAKSNDQSLITLDEQDKLTVDAEFTVNRCVSIEGDDASLIIKAISATDPALSVNPQNQVAINKVTPEATLDVDGTFKLSGQMSCTGIDAHGNMTVTDQLAIGDGPIGDSLVSVTRKVQEHGDSIRIKGLNNDGASYTQLALNQQGQLSLGTNQAQAQLHIYHTPDQTQPVVRIDDNSPDSSPFLIDAEGNVGIGVEQPTNKLDIAGRVRIGKNYHDEYVPDNSLVVEDRIGINHLSPDAHLHIENQHEKALTINQGVNNLLTVTNDQVTTDKPITTEGELTVQGQTHLHNNTSINADLSIAGNIHTQQNVTVAGSLRVDEPTTLNNTLDVFGETHLASTLAVSESTELKANLSVTGNSSLTGDVVASNRLSVEGETTLKSDVIIQGTTKAIQSVGIDLPLNPLANLHVGQSLQNTTAFRVDQHDPISQPAFLIKDGNIGIHQREPQHTLDMRGEANVQGSLSINALFNVDEHQLCIRQTSEDFAPLYITHNDDYGNSVASFTVNQGKVGVGIEQAQNNLDVGGNVRIGSSYDEEVVPENSLVVEDKIGINNLSPEAHLHIESEQETALAINQGVNNLLTVTDEQVTTDKSITTEGALNVKGQATVEDNTRINADLAVTGNAQTQGNVAIEGSLGVNESTTLANTLNVVGDTHLASTLLVQDNTVLEADLSVTGETKLTGDVTASNNIFIRGDVTVENQVTIHGITKAADAVGIDLPLDSDYQMQANLHVGQSQLNTTAFRVDQHDPTAVPALVIKDGNIGIHQDEPEHTLDLVGEAKVNGQLVVNTFFNADAHQLCLHQTHQDIAPFSVTYNDDNGNQQLSFMASQGKVGIATDSPLHPLHVAGTAYISQQLLVNGNAQLSAQLTITDDTHCEKNLIVEKQTTLKDDTFIYGKASVGRQEEPAEANMHIGQSAKYQTTLQVDQYSIDNSLDPALIIKDGLIGINNNAPAVRLDVVGDTHIDGEVQLKQTLNVQGQAHLNESLIVDEKIGIDIAHPAAQLHIAQTDLSEAALRIDGKPGAGQTPLVYNNGRLGVGIESPEKTLEVNGDTFIGDELIVQGRCVLDHTLDVDRDTLLKSDLTVFKDTDLVGRVSLGSPNDINNPETQKSQLYIADTNYNEALRIETMGRGGNKKTVVVKQGWLGVGTDTPAATLDIQGNAHISDNLNVQNELHVNQNAVLQENAEISGSITVAKRANFGSDTHIKGDLLVEDKTTIEEDLIVQGDTELENINVRQDNFVQGQLTVEGNTRLGKLSVDENATFKQPVEVQDQLSVQGPICTGTDSPNAQLHLQTEDNQHALIVEKQHRNGGRQSLLHINHAGNVGVGTANPQAALDVQGDTQIGGHLKLNNELHVSRNAVFESDTHIKRTLTVNDKTTLEQLQVEGNTTLGQQAQVQDQLIVHGAIGAGTATPKAKLDVQGNGIISQSLQIGGDLSSRTLQVQQGLRINGGPEINTVSADKLLGELGASDHILPTQLAVKTYIDSVASAFGSHGQVITISTQARFDELFNQGSSTLLPANCTVFLLPLKDSYDSGHTVPAYTLKNTVQIQTGTSIIGFNAETTRVVKQSPYCRFELLGTSTQKIQNVHFSGWVFDGRQLEGSSHGGAFFLNYTEHCELNCHIINHYTRGNGGAIYGQDSRCIKAEFIRGCQAVGESQGSENQRYQGGAAYGLIRSTIKAEQCQAGYGGAVAKCNQSEVTASQCHALFGGGAAYRCEQLRLTANDCSAVQRGGAAYYCNNLICEGFWDGNNAPDGVNIYANNNLTGDNEERHYWKGDFIGRRIDSDARVWRVDNE